MKNLNRAVAILTARMDELGDEAIQAMRSTPAALARQAENGRKRRAAEKKREAARLARKEVAIAANAFEAGQVVRHVRGVVADAIVVAVSGSTITLDSGRSFAAAAFVLA